MNQTRISKDIKCVLKFINHAVNYLDAHNIINYPDFIEEYKIAGCSATKLKDLIIKFKDYINEKKNVDERIKSDIEWINIRNLSKSNSSGRNIIINRLAYEYQDHFVDFSISYMQKINNCNYDFLKFKLNSKIEMMKNQSLNICQPNNDEEMKNESLNICQPNNDEEMKNESLLDDYYTYGININDDESNNDEYFNDIDFIDYFQLPFEN